MLLLHPLFLFLFSRTTNKLTMRNYDQDSNVFICSRIFCCFSLGGKGKMFGVYFAGILVNGGFPSLLCGSDSNTFWASIVCSRLVVFYWRISCTLEFARSTCCTGYWGLGSRHCYNLWNDHVCLEHSLVLSWLWIISFVFQCEFDW